MTYLVCQNRYLGARNTFRRPRVDIQRRFRTARCNYTHFPDYIGFLRGTGFRYYYQSRFLLEWMETVGYLLGSNLLMLDLITQLKGLFEKAWDLRRLVFHWLVVHHL